MNWLHFALLGSSIFCIAATVLPLVQRNAWWIRIFDYPRLQLTLLGVITLIGVAAFYPVAKPWEFALFGTLGTTLIYQLWMMWPYTPVASKQVRTILDPQPDRMLSVMVANVLMPNRKAASLITLVEQYQPDLLLTVETDDWWEEQLRPLETTYPHTLKHPQDDTYGMLLHSRFPLANTRIEFLVSDRIPSMHAQVKLPSGHRVSFHGLHPDPPNPRYATETTERDAELLVVARSLAEHNEPTIVAGDFNDVAWSYTTRLFQKVSGLLDPRRGRGTFNTFHADYRWMRWPLDHVFHSNHFMLVTIKCGPAWGSDHLPIFLTLALTPEAPVIQEEPEATPEENIQADEKIDAADPNTTRLPELG